MESPSRLGKKYDSHNGMLSEAGWDSWNVPPDGPDDGAHTQQQRPNSRGQVTKPAARRQNVGIGFVTGIAQSDNPKNKGKTAEEPVLWKDLGHRTRTTVFCSHCRIIVSLNSAVVPGALVLIGAFTESGLKWSPRWSFGQNLFLAMAYMGGISFNPISRAGYPWAFQKSARVVKANAVHATGV